MKFLLGRDDLSDTRCLIEEKTNGFAICDESDVSLGYTKQETTQWKQVSILQTLEGN